MEKLLKGLNRFQEEVFFKKEIALCGVVRSSKAKSRICDLLGFTD
jgi:hypothetical protein